MGYDPSDAVIYIEHKALLESVKSRKALDRRSNLSSNLDTAPKPTDIISLPYRMIIKHEIRRIVESIGNVIEYCNRG